VAITFPSQGATRKGVPTSVPTRVQVAGKFFARGDQCLRIHGVTYGPFALNETGEPFPASDRVAEDFVCMRTAAINSLRTYHVPPPWFLDLADEREMNLLVDIPWIDVPWRKHLDFLESSQVQREARQFVRQSAKLGAGHPCLLAYSIGNEIPSDILRWHGVKRVERFLTELQDVCKQADPDGLVTYASYPPTEYVNLSFLDFVTFNIYLHDREIFRRYLFRLQNLVGDKPLLLGELGMDTLQHGERGQADFLGSHVREALLMGLAGVFVFSWTDDWFTGGCPIDDWAFGITRADRSPKTSYGALAEVFGRPPAKLLPETPRVSVVVCSYNGGTTLDQCLRSLLALNYPDYEIIVVDDGSTDNTRDILARYPAIRALHQPNQGLSVARNVGLRAATGSIVAYTDSDCFADPDWLAHLVYQLLRGGAAAVGGPNLTPEDGRLAACVAAAPGQPTHVLESNQVAEHIPGCNMAFRKEALEVINGFDPLFCKAGDDVDMCWRLQQAGHWITFAPGAFVWHHRRQNPRAFLRQQAGYGEAEALLRFKHPDKFNGRGDGKWRGVLYGASLLGLRLAPAIIYRGTFGTGFFQCLYQPGPAHWALLPSTLEWHAAAVLVALAALSWEPLWLVVAAMLGLSVAVAGLQAAQARLPRKYAGFKARCLITALCYLQPLVRSWSRYRARLFSYRVPAADPPLSRGRCRRLPLTGSQSVSYWTGEGRERTELLNLVVTSLTAPRWGKVIDAGWSAWDLALYCHPWTVIQVCTAQQDYGSGNRLIRVRYRLRPSGYLRALAVAAALAAVAAVGLLSRPATVEAAVCLAICCAGWAGCAGLWWRGTYRASQAVAVIDALASGMGLIRCQPPARRGKVAVAPGRAREAVALGGSGP
jgi:GT2 family glycosyltransferase